jgi:hypothetical protein
MFVEDRKMIKYEELQLDIIVFESEDVIVTSTTLPNDE